jgi:hypothetical protein
MGAGMTEVFVVSLGNLALILALVIVTIRLRRAQRRMFDVWMRVQMLLENRIVVLEALAGVLKPETCRPRAPNEAAKR